MQDIIRGKEILGIPSFQKRIVFLEGHLGLHGAAMHFRNFLEKHGKDTVVIDRLYREPERILALKDIDDPCIIIQTTGLHAEQINMIVDEFEKLGIKIKDVVFWNEWDKFTWLIKTFGEKGVSVYTFYHDRTDNEIVVWDVNDEVQNLLNR